MARTDVVKHDLEPTLVDEVFDWENVEPMPLPVVPRLPSEEQPSAQSNNPTTTRVSKTDLTKAPYLSVGRMLSKYPGNEKWFGASGWVVARRAFITAGHCVFLPRLGGWITKAVFCPRFNNQCTKEYKGILVYTLKGWVEDTDGVYDMAACVISEDFASTEPPLAFETGIFTPGRFTAAGYPIKPTPKHQFNGKRMWKSVGSLVSEKAGIIWAYNDLTGGASGGPWCDPDGAYHVYGLNSDRADDPDQAASPAFLNGFDNLYNAVKNL